MTSTSVRPDRCRLDEQRSDLLAGSNVERAGRLVSKQQRRSVHERAGDRDPLALAAREPCGIGVPVRARSAASRAARPHGRDPRPPAFRRAARAAGRCRDGQVVEQVEELEDHPDPAAAEARRAGLAEPVDPRVGDGDRAARRPVEPGDQVQQRRLAAARRSHDRDGFARPDLEADPVERRTPAVVALA